MSRDSPRRTKLLGLMGIILGLVVFGVGALLLSEAALGGIALAVVGAIAYTWASVGRGPVVGGVVTGLVGAVFAWVAMRSMMRWVALSSGVSPVLTLEGTSAILLTSVVMSLLPAMGYVHFRRRFGRSFRKGLLYGVILALVGGIPVLVLLSGEIQSIAREPLIPASFILAVPVLYALVLEALHRLMATASAR